MKTQGRKTVHFILAALLTTLAVGCQTTRSGAPHPFSSLFISQHEAAQLGTFDDRVQTADTTTAENAERF